MKRENYFLKYVAWIYVMALGVALLPAAGAAVAESCKDINQNGVAAYHQGDYQAAVENFEAALDCWLEESGRRDTQDTATSYNNIGLVYWNLGDYERALENYNKALGIYLKVLGEEHQLTATSYNNIGAVYDSLGDYERALENYNKALGSLCGGAESPEPDDCRPVAGAVSAFWFRARALWETGRNADSAAAYTHAADALGRLRGAMKGEESKKHHGAEYYEMFPEGIGAFAALYEETDDPGALERAFEFAEKGIGRVFLEMVGRGEAVVRGGLPPDVLGEKQRLERQWKSALDAAHKEEGKPKDERDLSARKAAYENLAAAETELVAFEARLLEDYPDYAELMNPRTRPLEDIRDTVLAPGEAALEFYLGRKASYLIFITEDIIKVEELPPADEIENLVSLFRKKLTEPSSGRDSINNTASKLYDMLLGPVEQELAEMDRLLIVPTGKLYFLPFEALVTEYEEDPGYMIEGYRIRYAPSLNVMYLVASRRAERGDVWEEYADWLGFGDPVYDEEDERGGERGYSEDTEYMLAAYTRALAQGDEERGAAWRRLPGTGIEILAIAELFGLNEEYENVNLGLDASEENFKELAPEGSRYLHVASHGTLGEGGARQPAVVLSLVGNEESGENGFLTMTEAFNMKIPADMVVLSACKTGQGRMEKGEGVAGLSRAFLYAGADSLVVSLWSVADEETKDFMVGFYEKLLDGTDKETALLEAKREMIDKEMHPFYWAPFIFIGAN